MAFVSPPMKAACSAIVLLHRDVVANPNPILMEQWDYEVKQAKLIRDVRRLALHALDGILFSSDIAEIEYIYTRAKKDVPEEIRRLMQPQNFGIEEPKRKHRDAPRTFMHIHQLHFPQPVATDGSTAECVSGSWVMLELDQRIQMQLQQ